MENWGLIFTRPVHIVYREGLSNTNKEKITEVLAHEIAHMWYGNLVTMEWWNDLWLNEGFATYIGMKAADVIENSTTREEQLFMLDISGQSLRREEINIFNTHELSPRSLAGLSIQEMFSVITYNKAASVIKMVEKIVGPVAFRRALQLYLKRFAYANAARHDLFRVLNESVLGSHEGISPMTDINGTQAFSDGRFSLSEFMNGWVHQRGFPLVEIRRLPSGDLIADQALLWFNWDRIRTPYDAFQWKVPIFLGNSSLIWLEENATVLLPPTVPFDPHGLGYYRINYDMKSWEEMISALIANYNVYGIASRSRLLEDAFRIAFCGKLAFSVPIRLSQYLINEVEYAPFRIYAANFDFLSLLLHSIPGFHKVQGYFMDLLKPAFHRLINDSTVDGNHMKEALRDIVFVKLCSVNYPPCIAKLLPMFHRVKRRCEALPLSDFDCNTIHPTLRKAVYMTAVQFGSPDDYRFLMEKHREEPYSSERERIFSSLVVGRHPEYIERFFNETFIHNDLNNFVHRTVMNMILKSRSQPVIPARSQNNTRAEPRGGLISQ
uniref:Peptidase_M1 domain-containing protein n=1 Tax=Steinernema glaseri TaxID=37863 RepID=A0A1I7YQX4_9BILA